MSCIYNYRNHLVLVHKYEHQQSYSKYLFHPVASRWCLFVRFYYLYCFIVDMTSYYLWFHLLQNLHKKKFHPWHRMFSWKWPQKGLWQHSENYFHTSLWLQGRWRASVESQCLNIWRSSIAGQWNRGINDWEVLKRTINTVCKWAVRF